MKTLTLGQKIRQARKSKGLTQQDVVGNFITRNMLSKVENDVARPSIKTVEYLAKKLDKPVSYFLEELVTSSIETKSSAELAFEHSSYMIKNKETDKCISYIEDILANSTFNSSDVFHGRLLYNISYCYRHKGISENIEDYINKAISIFDRNNDYYYLTKAYFELGTLSIVNNEYDSAEKYFNKAIVLFNKSHVNDIMTEIELYHNLGYAYYKMGDYSEAVKTAKYTVNVSSESKYYKYSGDSHMLLASCYSKLNDLSKAISQDKQAVFFFDLNKDYDYKALCQENLGHYYHRKQLYEESKKQFSECLKYYVSKNRANKVNSVKIRLLNILVKKGEYSEALEYSKEIEVSHIDDEELAYFNNSLGKSYLELGQIEKSKQLTIEAEELAENLSELELRADICENLANIYSKEKDYEKAYKYSTKASELVKKSMEESQKTEVS